jgi:hypothetical protein
MTARLIRTACVVALAAILTVGCQSNNDEPSGNGGFFSRLTGSGGSVSAQPDAGIGVNSYLWRSTLDVLSFMPLSEVDPFGGVIITDWFANPELPDERFKATVFILDTRLRADALSVQLFKQARRADGGWDDAAIDPATRVQIENAILTRARQIRISQLND